MSVCDVDFRRDPGMPAPRTAFYGDTHRTPAIQAIVFDLDGVLIDSESIWDLVKKDLVERSGGTWLSHASADMMGMSPREWPDYMRVNLGLDSMNPDDIRRAVLDGVKCHYEQNVPLIAGACAAVQRMAARWQVGLASSSDRSLIDLVLASTGLRPLFSAVVASAEVGAGKPAPDVYLEACRQLNVQPANAAAVEDSGSGIVSASRAGMRVVAIPNHAYMPGAHILAKATVVLGSIELLSESLVASLVHAPLTPDAAGL